MVPACQTLRFANKELHIYKYNVLNYVIIFVFLFVSCECEVTLLNGGKVPVESLHVHMSPTSGEFIVKNTSFSARTRSY